MDSPQFAFGAPSMPERASRRRADPPLPAILRVRPALLLHLQPVARRSCFVEAALWRRVLVTALDHLRPGLQPIWREPPHGQDQIVVGDRILQPGAPFPG